MWSKEKLDQAAKARGKIRAQFSGVELAALAYARWKGLTEERDVDVSQAKAELDRFLDTMEPDDWQGLEALAGKTDERVFKGLMSYSLERSKKELDRQRGELDALPDWPVVEREHLAPSKSKRKKKRRDRSR